MADDQSEKLKIFFEMLATEFSLSDEELWYEVRSLLLWGLKAIQMEASDLPFYDT